MNSMTGRQIDLENAAAALFLARRLVLLLPAPELSTLVIGQRYWQTPVAPLQRF